MLVSGNVRTPVSQTAYDGAQGTGVQRSGLFAQLVGFGCEVLRYEWGELAVNRPATDGGLALVLGFEAARQPEVSNLEAAAGGDHLQRRVRARALAGFVETRWSEKQVAQLEVAVDDSPGVVAPVLGVGLRSLRFRGSGSRV